MTSQPQPHDVPGSAEPSDPGSGRSATGQLARRLGMGDAVVIGLGSMIGAGDLEALEVTLVASADAGALVRVIVGEIGGRTGPGSTYTPITLAHATIAPGARLAVPWRADFSALAYVLAGAGMAGGENRPVRAGQLAIFGPGDAITVTAASTQDSRTAALEVLLLGGRPRLPGTCGPGR